MLISVENGIVSYLDKNEDEQWRVNFVADSFYF